MAMDSVCANGNRTGGSGGSTSILAHRGLLQHARRSRLSLLLSLHSPLRFLLCSGLSYFPIINSFTSSQFPRATLNFSPNSLLCPPLPFSACQYSDLAEDERASLLEKFRQVTARWSQSNHGGAPDEDDIRKDERSHMIIVTDACLPLLSSGELPLNAHLLINYELPAKKETYARRLATCLTADGIVINMVVGGEVVTLKSIEESSNIVMQEMPMRVSFTSNSFWSSLTMGRSHDRHLTLNLLKYIHTY
ncbi:hypothetical protein LR48_Vigan06g033500 [Vigna angularis]|uniref:Helicase C-terminal domain-containing protein n=1 Tax=Phaseolus angularis TaxID=3914 RepID=A0A0L9UR83_PHAAN|nr:hypothetical protein LR48_Vigan06g033500 [Vigna angularis]